MIWFLLPPNKHNIHNQSITPAQCHTVPSIEENIQLIVNYIQLNVICSTRSNPTPSSTLGNNYPSLRDVSSLSLRAWSPLSLASASLENWSYLNRDSSLYVRRHSFGAKLKYIIYYVGALSRLDYLSRRSRHSISFRLPW